MIDKENIKYLYPLTPVQEGMLFHYLYDNDSDIYFHQLSYRINAQLDLNIFKQSWELVVADHDILRTLFIYKSVKRPVQVVLKKAPLAYREDTLPTGADCKVDQFLENVKAEDIKRKFNLDEETLFRVQVIRISDKESEVIISYHHMVLDGWSLSMLLNQMMTNYSTLAKGIKLPSRQPAQFGEYVRWIEKQDKSNIKSYWENYLSGYEKAVGLPKTVNVDAKEKFNFSQLNYSLNESVTASLHTFAKRNNVTINNLFYFLWAAVLCKYNNTDDVVFGITTSGRPPELNNVEEMIGLFINTIPVRIKIDPFEKVDQIIKGIQNDVALNYSQQYFSLAEIQHLSSLGNKLFDHILVFENYPIEETIENADKQTLNVSHLNAFEENNYDLALLIQPGKKINLFFHYNKNSYNEQELNDVLNCLLTGIESTISNDNEKFIDLEFVPADEKKWLHNLNNTAKPQLQKNCVELFEEQVCAHPQKTALVFEEKRLTYAELNSQVNYLTNMLINQFDLKRGDRVALLLERSELMIVSILAVLKAGAMYVPIEPEFPEERISYILNDANVSCILTLSKFNLASLNDYPLISMDRLGYGAAKDMRENPVMTRTMDDPMYIIYTSGTTGRPKGVLNSHRGIVNRINWQWKQFDYTVEDNIFQKTNYTFDVSVSEFFLSLCFGSTLTICSSDTLYDFERMIDKIHRDKITVIHFVPGLFSTFLNTITKSNSYKLSSLRIVNTSGDALPVEEVQAHHKKIGNVKLVNLYGPTEASVEVSYYVCKGTEKVIPIGKPIWNMGLYVLDARKQLLPANAIGEIYISGIGLANGYYNNEELTASKFIPNPFDPGTRLYKTGDLGRILSNGDIQFLGRNDSQIKLRGLRIELNEIENVLKQIEQVQNSIVQIRQLENGSKVLVAYILLKEFIEETQLKEISKRKLPVYMLPDFYLFMDVFPVNTSGKIDRKTFPLPEALSQVANEAPSSKMEIALADIWKEVLLKECINRNDHFFYTGGHSLKAFQVAGYVYKSYKIKLRLQDIFANPTLRELASFLEQQLPQSKNSAIEILPVKKSGLYSASFGQQRMWIADKLLDNKNVYNLPLVIELKGELKLNYLTDAFDAIVKRHESFRTFFQEKKGVVWQGIQSFDDLNFKLEQRDFSASGDSYVNARAFIQEEIVRAFELDKAPLIRGGIIKHNETHHLFYTVMHHIVSDAWSIELITKEFIELYSALCKGEKLSLPELKIQYKDYAEWQRTELSGEGISTMRAFWKTQLDNPPVPVSLPFDFKNGDKHSTVGDSVSLSFGTELTKSIKSFCERRTLSPFMFFMTVCDLLIYRYTGQKDLIIGSPVSGRELTELYDQVGFFINTVPVRVVIDPEETIENTLLRVKKTILNCLEYQTYPYELMLESINYGQAGSSSVFNIAVVMQNAPAMQLAANTGGVEMKVIDNNFKRSVVDTRIEFTEIAGDFQLFCDFKTGLYKKPTMDLFIQRVKQLAQEIILHPEKTITEIDVIENSDRRTEEITKTKFTLNF